MGLLYAERAVAEGAADVVLWDRNEDKLTAIAERLNAEPGSTRVHPYRIDVSDAEIIHEAAVRVLAEVGSPDVLINNAVSCAASISGSTTRPPTPSKR